MSVRISSCLAAYLLVVAAAGCGGGDGGSDVQDVIDDVEDSVCDTIDVDALDASAVVLAAGKSGGFLQSPVEEFLNDHHGFLAAYVFGDGSFMTLTQAWSAQDMVHTRTWREGQLPEADFHAMLAPAACLDNHDDGDYTTCMLLDGPTELAAINLPGASFKASAFASFTVDEECVADEYAVLPPAKLAEVAGMVLALGSADSTEFVPANIVLGGFDTAAGLYGYNPCTESNTTEWTFNDVDLQALADGASLFLEPPLSTQVRDFLTAHQSDHSEGYYTTCVALADATWVLYFDNAPDQEATLPL